MNTTHTVLSQNLEALIATVARMNKRAARLGVALLTLVVVGSRREERTVTIGADDFGHGITAQRTVSVTDVSITGETPKLSGWTLAGTVEHTPGGNIVRTVPGTAVDMVAYRTADPQGCDHCNTRRQRNDTFVVTHDDGRIARVGRTCLADYLGHKSVDALVWLADATREIGQVVDADCAVGGQGDATDLVEFLAWTAQSIGARGWVSRSAARDRDSLATADDALSTMGDYYYNPRLGTPAPTAADYATARSALTFVKADIDAQSVPNDYQSNLAVIMTNGYTTSRQAGYAASIVSYHTRAIAKKAEQAAQVEAGATSKHVGTIGERLTVRATLTRHNVTDGYYGTTHIYSFMTADGDVVSWFASREQDISVGDTVDVKGTVKKHDDYRGTAQTAMNRCKLTAVSA